MSFQPSIRTLCVHGLIHLELLLGLFIGGIVLANAAGTLRMFHRLAAKLESETAFALSRRAVYIELRDALAQATALGPVSLVRTAEDSLTLLLARPAIIFQRIADPGRPHWFCRYTARGVDPGELRAIDARSYLGIGTAGAGDVRALPRRLTSRHPDCETGELYRIQPSRSASAVFPAPERIQALIPLADRVTYSVDSAQRFRRYSLDSRNVQTLLTGVDEFIFKQHGRLLALRLTLRSREKRERRSSQLYFPLETYSGSNVLDLLW